MADVTEAQTTALVLLPKFSAAASIFGSCLILRDVTQRWHRNRTDASASSSSGSSSSSARFTTRHRLLAGMRHNDIMSSLAWFLTSWPMPEWVFWTKWNVGNQKTCSAQGFFVQWGMGTVWYNACLALYYLLVIRYGVRNSFVARKVEPWIHWIVISFTAGTSSTALAFGLFNPMGGVCWINANPPWCTQSHEGKGFTDCVRGDNARLYALFFWHIPVWCIMFFMVIAMILIFCKIRSVENNSLAHAVNPGRLQRQFAGGAIAYVGAMFLSWSLWTGLYIYWEVSGGKRVNWWLSFCSAVMLPMQGAFNAVIYFSSAFHSGASPGRQRSQRRRNTMAGELLPVEGSMPQLEETRCISNLCCFIGSTRPNRSAGAADTSDRRRSLQARPSSGRSSFWLFARMSSRQQNQGAAAGNDNVDDEDQPPARKNNGTAPTTDEATIPGSG